jgi:hypothetical protein
MVMSPVTHGWAAARAYCGVLFRLLQRCRDMRPGTRHFHTLEIFANVLILMQMTCMGRLGHVASGVPGATPCLRRLGPKVEVTPSNPLSIHPM